MTNELLAVFSEITVGTYKVERASISTCADFDQLNDLLFALKNPPEELLNELKKEPEISLTFGLRGEEETKWNGVFSHYFWHNDELNVVALGPEVEALNTVITESYTDESSKSVVNKLIQEAGLSAKQIDLPDETFEHLAFSNKPVWECLWQIVGSLNEYGHDLGKFRLWHSADGLYFTDKTLDKTWTIDDENSIERYLIGENEQLAITLTPGLMLGHKVHVIDKAKNIDEFGRVSMVNHAISERTARTYLSYEVL